MNRAKIFVAAVATAAVIVSDALDILFDIPIERAVASNRKVVKSVAARQFVLAADAENEPYGAAVVGAVEAAAVAAAFVVGIDEAGSYDNEIA